MTGKVIVPLRLLRAGRYELPRDTVLVGDARPVDRAIVITKTSRDTKLKVSRRWPWRKR